ncbi:hypothetical protein O988_05795 [Pseudogymnoascus sp. VKM F-3808]|nr:hypothetical protein O988_05795 [Pseudogymnoascus sp. VKM F-3808]
MSEGSPQFGDLPLELRSMIWEATFPRARIISTYRSYGDDAYYIPVALHVHSESRSQALVIYKKIELKLKMRASKATTNLRWKVMYFNPAVDVIQFAYADAFTAAFEEGRVADWCRQYDLIRRLGVAAGERIEQHQQRPYDLTQFSGLEELVPLLSIAECQRHHVRHLLDWEEVEEIEFHHNHKTEEDIKFRADAPGEMQRTATRWRVPRELKVVDNLGASSKFFGVEVNTSRSSPLGAKQDMTGEIALMPTMNTGSRITDWMSQLDAELCQAEQEKERLVQENESLEQLLALNDAEFSISQKEYDTRIAEYRP